MKTQLTVSELEEDIKLKEENELAVATDETTGQIQKLLMQLHEKDELIRVMQENIDTLEQFVSEKDQNIKKLMIIIKSLRKYVSY